MAMVAIYLKDVMWLYILPSSKVTSSIDLINADLHDALVCLIYDLLQKICIP